ncbi:MAG: transposase-like protein [Planctomycetaceae bacterium]
MWSIKFGLKYARRLKRKHPGYGNTFYVDEVFVNVSISGRYVIRAEHYRNLRVGAFDDWRSVVA